MFLKKLIAGIIALSAIFLMFTNGFQQMATASMHFMNSKIMATHQMPSQGCSQKSCFVIVDNTMLYATFFKPFVKEFLVFNSLLAGLSLLAFFITQKKRLLAFNPLNFNSGALAVSTIVFRE